LTPASLAAYRSQDMNRDTARALLANVCESEWSGNTLTVVAGWDLTVHAGRVGAPWSLQQVTELTLDNDLLSGKTKKGQRFAFPVDELRGAVAESVPTDKSGRKTGFM
jgi:hypothetical protein